MTEPPANLEQRVAHLETELADLMAELAPLREFMAQAKAEHEEKEARRVVTENEDTSEEILSWVDRAYILPRIATTSFILVIALALRTLTDSEVIAVQLGTLLGMVYAFVLIAYGCFSYSQKGAQAPVFTLWGCIVMCAVIVETQRVFQALPTVVAYLLLALLGWATVLMSRRFRVALPVFAGTIGMSLGAFAINYPNPIFPLLTGVLLLANVFAAFATGLLRASWLRWLSLGLALAMMQMWSFKLGHLLEQQPTVSPGLAMQGFLPAVSVLGLVFTAIALTGILGKIQQKVSKFDIVLPVINVVWIFGAANYAVRHGLGQPWVLGAVALLVGALYLGVAWWLAGRDGGDDYGITSFALAGGILVALALPSAVGNQLLASTILAALALGLAWSSTRIASGGVRLVAYLLQFYAGATLILILKTTEKTEPSLLGASASGFLALLIACHYLWARRTPPPPGEGWIDRFNRGEFWTSLLLTTALLSGFFTLRMGLYQGLEALQSATQSAFASGQSLLINLAATALLLFSLRKHDKELRNVGVLITVLAAGKVFLDVISLKGVALLISIFSFGVAAAVASVVLGRWGKVTAETETIVLEH